MKAKITIIALITGIFLLGLISFTSALIINSVSMSPNSIAPGETAKISLSMKNNGDNDLIDVSTSLDFTNLPLAPYNSGSDFTISELNQDKTKQADFQIIALNTAKSGIYKIPVLITYNENDIIKTKQSLISIMINSEPIVEASVEDGLLLKGQNNKITIKIINKGLADVKFLEIQAVSSTSYTLISQNNVYIGDVDSNDFQTAEFNVFFKDTSLTSVNFPITITYKDIANKEYNQEITIPLKVYTQKQAQDLGLKAKSSTGFYIFLIIVVIVIFVIYRIIRKRRRKQE
jgi:hypothetical protein